MRNYTFILFIGALLMAPILSMGQEGDGGGGGSLDSLRRLAEKGIGGFAQNKLATKYYEGERVSRDLEKASFWFRRAANQGFDVSQFNLAIMYKDGDGVPKSYVMSYMWANLAAAQGHSKAKRLRNLLSKQMTKEQIAEAQEKARNWKPD